MAAAMETTRHDAAMMGTGCSRPALTEAARYSIA